MLKIIRGKEEDENEHGSFNLEESNLRGDIIALFKYIIITKGNH